MASKHAAAYGIYPDHATAQDAVESLKSSGFRAGDISLLLPDNVGSKDFAHEKHTKAPEGAVAGGGTGGIVGAAVGYLAAAGSFMFPGLESLAAAGPVVATLGGLGAGALLGGITGGLFGLGVPEYEAKRYVGRVRRGGVLMSVHCDDMNWAKTAMGILKRTGAVDVSVRPTARGVHTHADKPVPTAR